MKNKNKILILVILMLLAIVAYQAIVISNAKIVSFTENDMHRIRDIILKNIVATDLDYKVYDLNNDGVLDGFDIMIIKRHFLGLEKTPNIKIIKAGDK